MLLKSKLCVVQIFFFLYKFVNLIEKYMLKEKQWCNWDRPIIHTSFYILFFIDRTSESKF